MIQRISFTHVQQLDDRQKELLRDQWTPQEGEYIAYGDQEEMIYFLNGFIKSKSLPLLTIGQMIHYLHKQDDSFAVHFTDGEWRVTSSRSTSQHSQLCDALWDTMRMVL